MNVLSRTLVRQDPFDNLLRGFFIRPVDLGDEDAPSIKLDVREQDTAYLVHAEIPGVHKEDINISIDGAQISITAERKLENDVKDGERVLRSERYFGKIARSFQLGQDIDDATAKATFRDGVLELTLPKRAAAQTKRLTVN